MKEKEIILEIKRLLDKVEYTRKILNDLIDEKQNCSDSEILVLSQELDQLLNEYDEHLKQNK